MPLYKGKIPSWITLPLSDSCYTASVLSQLRTYMSQFVYVHYGRHLEMKYDICFAKEQDEYVRFFLLS